MEHITDVIRKKRAETATTIAADQELAPPASKAISSSPSGHACHTRSPRRLHHAMYRLRERDQDPLKRSNPLNTIDAQMQTLVRFVNELLDLSRISRGVIEITPELLDFAAVVRDAVHVLQPFIEQRRHVVSLVLPAALYVRGDSSRLLQIVTHLVENAARTLTPAERSPSRSNSSATKRSWP